METEFVYPYIGQHIRCIDTRVSARAQMRECVVEMIDRNDNSLAVYARFINPVGINRPGVENTFFTEWFRDWQPVDDPIPGTLPEISHAIDALQAEVVQLRAARDRAVERGDREEERARKLREHYDHDMLYLDTKFKELKVEQQWCDSGYNEVVDVVNNQITGGFQFTEARKLVQRKVDVRGETTVKMDVWIWEGDDPKDSDVWMDEDGESVNGDEWMRDALDTEYTEQGKFDWVEVQFLMATLTITVTTSDPGFDPGQIVGDVISRMEDIYGVGGPRYDIVWETV